MKKIEVDGWIPLKILDILKDKQPRFFSISSYPSDDLTEVEKKVRVTIIRWSERYCEWEWEQHLQGGEWITCMGRSPIKRKYCLDCGREIKEKLWTNK